MFGSTPCDVWSVTWPNIDTVGAGSTEIVDAPRTFWNVALISTLPTPTPVTIPLELTVARVVFVDDQLAEVVTLCELLLEKNAVALICDVAPTWGPPPETETDVTTGEGVDVGVGVGVGLGSFGDDCLHAGTASSASANAARSARIVRRTNGWGTKAAPRD
jgi:hypothetical protein